MKYISPIHLANTQGVSATVRLLSVGVKQEVKRMWNGQLVRTQPLFLSGAEPLDLGPEPADTLVADDREIHELVGMPLSGARRIYVEPATGKPARHLTLKEVVLSATGEEQDVRERVKLIPNLCDESKPVRPFGKLLPIEQAFRAFAFKSVYQIGHTDALSYGFLREIAQWLHDSNSMTMVGAGHNGKQPLVLKSAGLPHRAFLRGMVSGEAYVLAIYLTNLELKRPVMAEVEEAVASTS